MCTMTYIHDTGQLTLSIAPHHMLACIHNCSWDILYTKLVVDINLHLSVRHNDK